MKDFTTGIATSIDNTIHSLTFVKPEVAVVAGFLLVIVADLFLAKRFKYLCFGLTLVTLAIAVGFHFNGLKTESVSLFGGMLVYDHLSIVLKFLIGLVTIVFVLFVHYHKSLQQHKKGTGDLYSIVLGLYLGLSLMVMSQNLLMIYLSLEMVSVGSYLLVGYQSKTPAQSEAAMKYALFGAVCSAFLLYGMSLLYGFTGTLDITDPSFVGGLLDVDQMSWPLPVMLILVGVGFKLSLVPFHLWAPDVYEGAPTPVTAFLSTAPKIAAFILLIRFLNALQPLNVIVFNNNIQLSSILAIFAILSMVVGNFGAIWQNNVKRMLAYSSIGHTGFMFMAVFMISTSGVKSLVFYMFIYSIMNMAAFLIVDEIEERTGFTHINQYKGLGKAMGLILAGFVIVLVSLTGLPPTAGFTAKFLVFSAALESYAATSSKLLMLMVIAGAVTTVVSLFYYFRIPLNAYLRKNEGDVVPGPATPKVIISLALVSLLILFMLAPSIVEGLI